MQRYPVYRALYKPILMCGVPLMQFIVEVLLAILCAVSSLWIAIIPILIFHVLVAVLLKQDSFYFQIFLDVLMLHEKKKENGRAEK